MKLPFKGFRGSFGVIQEKYHTQKGLASTTQGSAARPVHEESDQLRDLTPQLRSSVEPQHHDNEADCIFCLRFLPACAAITQTPNRSQLTILHNQHCQTSGK